MRVGGAFYAHIEAELVPREDADHSESPMVALRNEATAHVQVPIGEECTQLAPRPQENKPGQLDVVHTKRFKSRRLHEAHALKTGKVCE